MRTTFSRAKRIRPDFNDNKKLPEDEQLNFEYAPLEYGEWNAAVEIITRLGFVHAAVGGEKKIVIPEDSKADQEELFKLFRDLLPKHVKSVGAPLLPNVNDGKQEAITIDEIAHQAAFVLLATELLATLIAVSAPTEADLKN